MDKAGASPDAAVAAASYTALAYYFPAQAGTLGTTYTSYLAGLPAAGKNAGVAIGAAAADDIIALRTGDGRDASISTSYGQGPLTPGVWIFCAAPICPVGADALGRVHEAVHAQRVRPIRPGPAAPLTH